jgi:putative lipoic acid-binding regulatory protein
MAEETLLEFPCDFPLKIMGEARDDFAAAIVEVVRQHAPDFDATRVEIRASSGGKYISLTCIVTATSKPQLNDLYRALTAHPWVKVVL